MYHLNSYKWRTTCSYKGKPGPLQLHLLVPDSSRQFQTVPDSSRQFQTVPDSSRQFQTVLYSTNTNDYVVFTCATGGQHQTSDFSLSMTINFSTNLATASLIPTSYDDSGAQLFAVVEAELSEHVRCLRHLGRVTQFSPGAADCNTRTREFNTAPTSFLEIRGHADWVRDTKVARSGFED